MGVIKQAYDLKLALAINSDISSIASRTKELAILAQKLSYDFLELRKKAIDDDDATIFEGVVSDAIATASGAVDLSPAQKTLIGRFTSELLKAS